MRRRREKAGGVQASARGRVGGPEGRYGSGLERIGRGLRIREISLQVSGGEKAPGLIHGRNHVGTKDFLAKSSDVVGRDSRTPRNRGRFARKYGKRAGAALLLPPGLPVRVRFEGAEPEPRVVGLEELLGKVYYSPAHSKGRLVGHSTFRRVRNQGLRRSRTTHTFSRNRLGVDDFRSNVCKLVELTGIEPVTS